VLTDAALVKCVLAGDSVKYAELVRRYEGPVQAAAWSVVHDVHLAQDIAQEAFLKAYRALPSLADPELFGPWLLTIARHAAVTVSRSKTLAVGHGPVPEVAADSAPDEEEASALLAAVARLPEHEQRVILLRYIDQQPIAAIAAMTGLSSGTVTKQISRALVRLRTIVKEPP
jgi:RNA polymerase sigma-70 factor, ECF subfamily